MDRNHNERQAAEDVRKALSDVFTTSGAHQATEARLTQAKADIAFAIFVFFVSVLTFVVGVSEQDHKPFDAGVIKLLSAVPFLGAAWLMHRGHKVLRDRARSLQAKADEVARKSNTP